MALRACAAGIVGYKAAAPAVVEHPPGHTRPGLILREAPSSQKVILRSQPTAMICFDWKPPWMYSMPVTSNFPGLTSSLRHAPLLKFHTLHSGPAEQRGGPASGPEHACAREPAQASSFFALGGTQCMQGCIGRPSDTPQVAIVRAGDEPSALVVERHCGDLALRVHLVEAEDHRASVNVPHANKGAMVATHHLSTST